jgi:hypothetical protein
MDLRFLVAIFAVVGMTIGLGALFYYLRRRKLPRKEQHMHMMTNWFQIRGLGALAIRGLFLLHVVLVGLWKDWAAKRRAPRTTDQVAPGDRMLLSADRFGVQP